KVTKGENGDSAQTSESEITDQRCRWKARDARSFRPARSSSPSQFVSFGLRHLRCSSRSPSSRYVRHLDESRNDRVLFRDDLLQRIDIALELGDVALDGVDFVGRVVELLRDGRLSPGVRAAERSDEERGANDERAMAGADEGTNHQSAE